MSWIMIILSIIGNLPSIWNLIKEILAMLKKQPAFVQSAVKSEVMDAVRTCQDERTCGVDPDHSVLARRLSEILAKLKN